MKNSQHTMTGNKGKLFLLIAIFVALSTFRAEAQLTAAAGGGAISADNVASVTYTTLTGPIYDEAATAAVGTGTIILNAPTGFSFDIGGAAPTVLMTRISGTGGDTRNINDLASGSSIATTRTASTISCTITAASSNSVRCRLTWQNVRVIPTAGTPLASGNITKTGTSVITGITNSSTNMGTLTEVAGAVASFTFNTISSPQCANSISATITAKDQYGNNAAYTGTAAMTTTAGTVTPATSNAFSGGTLTQTFAVSGSGASQTLTATKSSPTATGTSNAFTINARPNISGTLSVCAGSTTTLTGTGTPHGTTPWASASPSFATVNSSGVVGGVASGSSVITYMDNNNCSNTATVTVNASNAVSVSIAPSPSSTVCAGTNVTFTATPTNGGASPVYQWKLNGGNVGTNSTTYSNNALANGDVVTCELTSNVSCPTGNPATSNAINMTVNPTNAVSVSIGASPSGAICAGTNVTFTATPTNGGGAPSYQWKLNGGNVGTNSNSYSNSSLANGDVVTCELTSNVSCPAGNPATSNAINMTVNPTNAVSVSIGASPSGAICAGTNVTFTATPTNGGASPSYQWKLNGSNVGINSATYSNNALVNGDVVTCELTSNVSCPTGNPATSNSINMTVNSYLPVSVSVGASPSSTICAGTNVTFTATPTNGGASPSYQWKLNGGNVGTNSTTYSNSSLANGDVVSCVLTSNYACPTGNPAASNDVTMTVNPTNAVSVSIGASPSGAICAGANVTFTATPVNGGASPSYQWKLNGGNVGTNSTTYSNNGLANGDVVTCVLTSNVSCPTGNPATSNAINMTVNPILPVSVSIGASPSGAICAGTNVTFTATPTNAGASPVYQWKLNGGNVGTNSATYSNNALANGDVVTCELTSNATCPSGNPATSNAINMTVNPILPVSVSISPSPSSTICAGTNVTFTATPTNGGASPAYQWKVNGSNVGTNSATYSNASLANGNIVTCVLTSNAICPSGNPATSNSVTMTVNPTNAVSITIGASPSGAICAGTNVTFTATPTNGGTSPVYQWKLNGGNVGSGGNTYSNSSLANGNVVTCELTSNVSCPTGNPATSNAVNMQVNAIPVATATNSSQTRCSGVAFTTMVLGTSNSVAGTTFAWTRDNGTLSSGNVTGIAASGSGNITGSALVNTTNAPVTVTFTIIPTGPAPTFCVGSAITATVLVNPTPVGSASAQSICTGSATSIALNSNVSGTTFTWTQAAQSGTVTGASNCASSCGTTITQTLSSAAGGVRRYTVTPVANGCTGSNFTVDATVNAIPVATATNSNQTICEGASFTTMVLSTSNSVTGTTFAWTRNNTTEVTGIAASGSGNITGAVLQNTTNAPVTVTFTITPTGPAPTFCVGSAITTSITVNPTPVGSASPQSICSATATSIALNSTVSGTSFTWTQAALSGTISGASNCASSCGSTITQTLTSAAGGVRRYTVTPTANSCPGSTFTVDVTVNPLPGDNAGANVSICNGANTVIGAAPTVGNTYSWSPSGTLSSATASNPTATPTSTTSYTLTETITATGCSASNSVVVTVNTVPIATATNASQTICEGSSFTTMSLSTSNGVTGTTFAWTRNNITQVTGIAASGSGNITGAVLQNTTNAPVTVTFTITPTGPTPTFCVGSSITTTVVVNPTPVGSATAQTICSGSATSIALNSTVSGTSFTWTQAAQSGTVTGASNCAASCGTTIAQTLSSVAGGVRRYTVTPAANSCVGSIFTVDATVHAGAVITNQPVAASACLGQGINLSVTATGTSLTYQWRKNGSNIIGATSSTYSIANTIPTDAGNYDVVVSNTGCGPVTSNSVAVTLTSPSSPPWSENFESITVPNEYPNCMSSTNLGSNTFTRTYGGAGGTLGAHSGTDFGSWGDNADDWFFTGAILVPAGITYEFSYWYWTDNSSSFTSMDAGVGTSPTVAAMTTPVGTALVGAAVGPINTWKKYSGTFTAPTTGVYYFGIHTTTNPGNAPDKIVIDDAGFMEVCSGAPTAGTAHTSVTCLNSGETANLSLTGYTDYYAGIEFQWQSSPKGANSWSNINGAIDTLQTVTVTANTDYRCVVRCIYSNQTSNSNVVTVNVNPTQYNVSGGACAPVNIGVSGSQVGVSYQIILNGNVHTTPPQMGTGGPISFGNQVDSGIYAVLATDVVTGCNRMMIGVATVNFCTSTWLGVTDSLWTTQTNWDPAAVPNNCYVNVVINAGTPFKPEISGTNIYVRNISMASGVTLNLRNQDMFVCGNWIGGPTTNALVVGNGTVHMVGQNGYQNIGGATQFDTLQINNNGLGVKMVGNASISITGGLHLQHNDLSVGSGSLTLLSKASNHHAYIDDFTFGFDGTITGNIQAERYIPTPGYNQHFISSPVTGALLSQIGASGPDNVYITPSVDCDEAHSAFGSAYGSTFVYNDGHMGATKCMLGNWMIKSQGTMEVGRGYSSYQTGNTIRTLTGTANTGDITISGLNNSGYPTVNTLQGQPIESGWNLVGNPYPSSIDLTIDRSSEGFQNQVQVWQTTGPFSGTWQPLMITGVPGTVVIPPFQAFMVRVDSGSIGNHTFKFYQSERIRDNSKRFYRTQAENSLILELTYANGGKDETKLEFNPEGTVSFDGLYDANKPGSAPGKPTLYTHMNTNLWYGINTLPSLNQATTVPMGLRADMNGSMTISAKGIQSFDPTTYIFLEDKKTGAWHNLRNGDYAFTAAKTDNQHRFVLHFTPPAKIMTSDATCSGSGMIQIEQPGSANWNYSLADENSVVISSGTLNAGSSVTLSANAGTYLLTLSDNNGYVVMKNIQVTGTQPIVAAFTSDLNVAVPNENIIFTSTTNNAATYQWDFGDGAIGSGATTTHSYFSEGIYNVQLLVMNEGGCSSTMNQTVTITSRAATGLNSIVANKIDIWSNEDYVYVDFTKEAKVEAEIDMYNVMGQLISREQFNRQAVYSKQITNMPAAYVIVKVINEDQTTTKKVFIAK